MVYMILMICPDVIFFETAANHLKNRTVDKLKHVFKFLYQALSITHILKIGPRCSVSVDNIWFFICSVPKTWHCGLVVYTTRACAYFEYCFSLYGSPLENGAKCWVGCRLFIQIFQSHYFQRTLMHFFLKNQLFSVILTYGLSVWYFTLGILDVFLIIYGFPRYSLDNRPFSLRLSWFISSL